MIIYINLQVALHISGAYNLTLHLPVVIGTVPFRQAPNYRYTDSHFYRETQLSNTNELAVPLPPPYRESITPPPPFDGKLYHTK